MFNLAIDFDALVACTTVIVGFVALFVCDNPPAAILLSAIATVMFRDAAAKAAAANANANTNDKPN